MKQLKYTVRYRRRMEGKTNYKKRLKLLLSKKPRLVIRHSLNNVIAQIIKFMPEGDVVLASAHSNELKKLGWSFNGKNISAAYLVGLLVGKKAIKEGIKEVILDIGLKQAVKGSRIFACLKGAIDSGLNINHDAKVLPKEDRIKGKHVENYANKIREKKESYQKQFSGYVKAGADPAKMAEVFDEIKKKIMG